MTAMPRKIHNDTSQENDFYPHAVIADYMPYVDATGVVQGNFRPVATVFQTPSGATAVVSYYDGAVGSAGVHRYDVTLTYTDGTRTTLSSVSPAVLQ